MFLQSLLGLGTIQMRKTIEIQVSQIKNTRIADNERKAKCLSMFCHSDILIEKQNTKIQKIRTQILGGSVLRIFFR